MGGILRNSSSSTNGPQTPLLQPQIIEENDSSIPDFFLDDDAGVGSPMDMDSDDESEASLSTILALGALSPRSASPAPSLVADDSMDEDEDEEDEEENNEESQTKEVDRFKFKKFVKFLDSVVILPHSPEEAKETAQLKPPHEVYYRNVPGGGNGLFSGPENAGILSGLGRAGSPRPSMVSLHQQDTPSARRPLSPSTPQDSDDEVETPVTGDTLKAFRRKAQQQYRRQLRVPLHPPPAWRMTSPPPLPPMSPPPTKSKDQFHPRIKSPSQEIDDIDLGFGGGGVGGYEEERYVLGQTSPVNKPRYVPPRSPPLFPLLPPSLDGVYRLESRIRESREYNNAFYDHHSQQRHQLHQQQSQPTSATHLHVPQLHLGRHHNQHQTQHQYPLAPLIVVHSYSPTGELSLQDQYGRKLSSHASIGSDGGFKLNLSKKRVKVDEAEGLRPAMYTGHSGKIRLRSSVAAVPGGPSYVAAESKSKFKGDGRERETRERVRRNIRMRK